MEPLEPMEPFEPISPMESPPETPKRRWVLKTIAGLALLIVGMGIGSASQPVAATSSAYRTPPSCVEAMDLAAQGLTVASGYLDILTDAVTAAYLRDTDGIERATERMEINTAKIVALQGPARTAAQDCRSKA